MMLIYMVIQYLNLFCIKCVERIKIDFMDKPQYEANYANKEFAICSN